MNDNLPKGWIEVELEKCCDILDNIRVPINSDERAKRHGNVPYYGATGQVGWIDDYLFDEELVLIGEDGAPFYDKSKNIAYIIKGKSWVNNHAHVLRAREMTTNKFVSYFLNNFDYNGYVNGTTRLKLTQGKLKEIPILIPPLPEQRRIVKKLDVLISRISNSKTRLEKIPTLLKNFRQAILAAAVAGELTKDWREKNKNVESSINLINKSHKERSKLISENKREYSKLPEVTVKQSIDLPESWALTTPENIASPKKHSLAIGPFGSNLKVSDYKEFGVPLVFVRHIKANNFSGLSPKYITKEKALELEAHSIESLDLVITKMGEPPGDCEIYPEGLPNAIITADCLKFKVWNKYFDTIFLKYAINSMFVKEQLGIITLGVAQQKISLERFKSILIPIPPFDEQKEIVREINELFDFAISIETRYQKANIWFNKLPQAILAKTFRGELVPQNENDEHASVLMERIEKSGNKLSKKKTNVSKSKIKKSTIMQAENLDDLKSKIKKVFRKRFFQFTDIEELFPIGNYNDKKDVFFSLIKNKSIIMSYLKKEKAIYFKSK